ncbi:MAG: hypothetical protein KBD76_09935 [Bacteriovorax sp.]|nr:hypothetical protein [Bacteriovorax sp.]
MRNKLIIAVVDTFLRGLTNVHVGVVISLMGNNIFLQLVPQRLTARRLQNWILTKIAPISLTTMVP